MVVLVIYGMGSGGTLTLVMRRLRTGCRIENGFGSAGLRWWVGLDGKEGVWGFA